MFYLLVEVSNCYDNPEAAGVACFLKEN